MRAWAITALILLGLLAPGCATTAVWLKGTDLGKEAAPDFQLTSDTGKKVALADLHGKVVVLTFLYTHCPDVCPLIAGKLKVTADTLGDAMRQVAFLAVSIDPRIDTPANVQTFLQQHQLTGVLTYLIGTPDELKPVWAAYYVAAQPDPRSADLVSHSTRVVVIDKQGRQRVNLDADFDPGDLAQNVRVLLGE